MATNEKKKKAAPDAAETTQEEPAQEAAQADTAAVPDAETKPETAPEEAPEELQEVARSLMREHGVSQVYRCPINGYWFIREEYVKEYVAESGNEVETYTNEVKVEDHDA